MKIRTLMLTTAASVLAVGGLAAPVDAAPHSEKVLCYVFSIGTCLTDANGITATVTAAGGGVALYVEKSNIANKVVGDIRNVGYTVTGSQAARFTFQTVGRGFVSVETATCNDGAGRTDVINDGTCSVNFNDGSGSYANWAAFVAANPTLRSERANTPFILLDTPGTATFSNVELGRPAK